MITILLYILFLSIFILDWLYFVLGVGNRYMTWIPEFISLVLFLYIPFNIAFQKKRIYLHNKYIIILIVFILHIALGFAINNVPSGAVFFGMRTYFKAIPLFLLPAVYKFDDPDIIKLSFFILMLAFIQLPVVIWQRFITYAAIQSGDPMGGTLGHGTSGVLSLFLLIVISFLVAYYLKEKIPFWFFMISSFIVFLPTTMNETKITFIVLPLSLLLPAIFLKSKRKQIVRIILILIIVCGMTVILKGVYNHFQEKKDPQGIMRYAHDKDYLEEYIKRRTDPLIIALEKATENIQVFVFGRGAGNVSVTFSTELTGRYAKDAVKYRVGEISITQLIWEIGVIGTLIFMIFVLMVFFDSIQLCKRNDLVGAFSLGMITFSIIFVGTFFYAAPLILNIFMYLFYLSAGYVVSYKMRGN